MVERAARIESAWRLLSRVPGGRWLFARLLGLLVPYSGSVHPRVHTLEPGRTVLSMRERRRLRNHLGSVHALALANLGELASGLAMTLTLPASARGIPIRLVVDYHKKARGTITAEGRANPPRVASGGVDAAATAELRDEAGEVVADMVVTWRVSPTEE
jgi:acyl-coenzyme A thioesterase PaaI-like protein